MDDNKAYREAFRRNLILHGYEVTSAEDSLEALDALQQREPDVIVTDLAMRHPTEGLDLIRQVRALRPHLPLIMISAVGTFDEGAEATRLGARQVISKSRIDQEMGSLYQAIDEASAHHAALRQIAGEIESLARAQGAERAQATTKLGEMLRRDDLPASIKGEIYDAILSLAEEGTEASPDRKTLAAPAQELLSKVEETLAREIPRLKEIEEQTRLNLTTAEYMFQQSQTDRPEVDFSRAVGFAYCFAVENEIKARLRKKMQKFFGDAETPRLIESLLEENRKKLSIFYQQYLLRVQKGPDTEATLENFFHTFLRILEHRARYKPDGLKALGIVLICFGRSYSFKKFNQEVRVDNPLGLRGLEGPDEVLAFARLLINLQHYRNPYIHPEISEMTKLSKIRETALACLNHAAALN